MQNRCKVAETSILNAEYKLLVFRISNFPDNKGKSGNLDHKKKKEWKKNKKKEKFH